MPNQKLSSLNSNIADIEKKDITFSVGYYHQVDSIDSSYRTGVVNTFRKYFDRTNLFSKIHYVSTDEPSYYHYHFMVRMVGEGTHANHIAIGYLSGIALMLIPFWLNNDIDITMTYSIGGKEIYSVTIAERMTEVFWLPLVAVSPIFNSFTAEYYIENKVAKYFMNEIMENKLY
jgi:hypothetical protein